jgi:hypothetical protein
VAATEAPQFLTDDAIYVVVAYLPSIDQIVPETARLDATGGAVDSALIGALAGNTELGALIVLQRPGTLKSTSCAADY